MELAIDIQGLRKTYSDKLILKNINLKVPKGSIYGFLGQNGQGKSTTIKLLTGVLPADSGSISLLGEQVSFNAIDLKRNIGCLIDSPCNYPNLTAAEFLNIACILKSVNKLEISRVLEKVNVTIQLNT